MIANRYVWLVPATTSVVGAAATRFQVVVQDCAFPGMADLAKGAKHEFRYAFAWPNPNEARKITEVMLFRSKDVIDRPPHGWDQITSDLNWERGGDFLYLISKTKPT